MEKKLKLNEESNTKIKELVDKLEDDKNSFKNYSKKIAEVNNLKTEINNLKGRIEALEIEAKEKDAQILIYKTSFYALDENDL